MFSEKLKELRKARNLTQEELSKQIFISRSTIAKYESGASLPTEENAMIIAEFFDVKVSWLINQEEHVKLSLEEFHLRKISNIVLLIAGILTQTLYAIFCFLPLLPKKAFNVGDGSTYIESYRSVVGVTLEHHNPIGLIAFIFCIIGLALLILPYAIKHQKTKFIFRICSYIVPVVSILLIFFAVALAAYYS